MLMSLLNSMNDCICICRSNRSDVFLVKCVLKICSKFTGEHSCRSVISIKLLCNIIEIALRHGCSPVNLLHIFRTPFTKNTSGWLLLYLIHFNLIIPWLQLDDNTSNRHLCPLLHIYHIQDHIRNIQ